MFCGIVEVILSLNVAKSRSQFSNNFIKRNNDKN